MCGYFHHEHFGLVFFSRIFSSLTEKELRMMMQLINSLLNVFIGNEQIDESKRNLPDGREFTFNKTAGGRTYPSLVVVARPNLHNKEISPQITQKERAELGISSVVFIPTYDKKDKSFDTISDRRNWRLKTI